MLSIVLSLTSPQVYASNLKRDTEPALEIEKYILVSGESLTFEQIRSKPIDEWEKVDVFPSYGFSNDDFWLHINLNNLSKAEKTRILRFVYPLHDYVDIFVETKVKTIVSYQLGDKVHNLKRKVRDKNVAIRLALASGNNNVWIKVKSKNAIVLSVDILEEEEHQVLIQLLILYSGIIYGILMVMALYNLGLAVSVLDKAYFAYVAYVLSFVGFTLALTGDGYYYIWGFSPGFNEYSMPFFAALMVTPSIIFPYYLLNIEKNLPSFRWVFKSLPRLTALFLVLIPFLDIETNLRVINSFSIIIAFFLVGMGVYLSFMKVAVAAIYTLAWTIPLLGFAVLSLSSFGVLESNWFTQNASILGGVIETIILSLALAQRIRLERKAKLGALSDAFAAKEEASRNRAMYEELFSSAPIGIFRCDIDGNLHAYNAELSNILERKEVSQFKNIELCVKNIIYTHPKMMKELTNGSQIIDRPIEVTTDWGGKIVCSISMHLDIAGGPDEENELRSTQLIECYLIDITERVKAENRQRKMEELKMSSLEQLVVGVAHEVNTPIGNNLMAISQLEEMNKFMADRLASNTITVENFKNYLSQSTELIEMSHSNLDFISELIRRFKHVSVKQLDFSQQTINLREHIKLVTDLFKLATRDIRFAIHGDKSVILETYPDAWESILRQLINNSVVHGFSSDMDTKLIDITLKKRNDGSLVFVFQDNGAGVKGPILGTMFDPFTTSNRGDKKHAGLGLFQVHNIVTQLMGGRIHGENDGGLMITIEISPSIEPLVEDEK